MDELTNFLRYFLQEFPTKTNGIGAVPLRGAVGKVEDVTKVLWHRHPPYQVQLFIAPPDCIIPAHMHPNVDSYEVFVGGQMQFSLRNEWVTVDAEEQTSNDYGLNNLRGQTIRVLPHDLHGGVAGPEGSVFFSVQHWINGVEPHCVAADYVGVAMGQDHADKIVYGHGVVNEELSEENALLNKPKID